MKQKQPTIYHQLGFTVIELLAVLSIMAMIATVLILDFSSQRATRNIVLAENETITNIRKVQNYMLSARDISPGVPAKFYVLTLESGASTYRIDAIDSDYVYHEGLELVTLPNTIAFSGMSISSGTDTAKPKNYTCLQIVFSAPIGAMYVHGGTKCGSTSLIPIVSDPINLAKLGQNLAIIGLNVIGNTNISKTLYINPSTGQISSTEISSTTEAPIIIAPPKSGGGKGEDIINNTDIIGGGRGR